MINEYISIDGLCKVYIDTAVGGTIKAVQLSDNDTVEFVPTAEDKEAILSYVGGPFYYGNLMMKIAKALDKLITGD